MKEDSNHLELSLQTPLKLHQAGLVVNPFILQSEQLLVSHHHLHVLVQTTRNSFCQHILLHQPRLDIFDNCDLSQESTRVCCLPDLPRVVEVDQP